MTEAAAIAGSPLTAGRLPRLAALLDGCPRRASEYTLANLYLYRARHDYRLVEAPAPALLGVTYDGERHALPLGPLTPGAVEALLDRADCLYPLGEDEASALAAAHGLRLDWRDEDTDYVYDAARLARLSGAKVKRAQARAFAEEAAPRMVALDAACEAAAREVLEGWLADSGRGEGYADIAECREALTLREALGLEGRVVFAGQAPVGFLLAGPPRLGARVVHFAKGRRAFAGVYPWMFATFAADCGAAELNFEQDLGKPGLAQSKRALAPLERRRKFRVRKA